MFRNLSTSTKLLLLCGLFVLSLAVTTYSLVSEKQIAIEFARKELAGSADIARLSAVYDAVLAKRGKIDPAVLEREFALLELQGSAASKALAQELTLALRAIPAAPEGLERDSAVRTALEKTRALILRIGDDSNLALDPDLDSYYLQTIVVSRMAAWLGQMAGLRMLADEVPGDIVAANERRIRFQVLEGILLANLDAARGDIASALRGANGESLKATAQAELDTAFGASRAYLNAIGSVLVDNQSLDEPQFLERSYSAAAVTAMAAWATAQVELGRLLRQRIDGLLARMRGSLAVTGILAALSLLIAYLTYRHIVKPLSRLEALAGTVRETKNYQLRMDYVSNDEIGKLAAAFNAMLAELASAREREKSEQAELSRVTKLTTMGAMTASIAHEVNQPLAAVVANSNAALRWLARQEPDLDEARSALQRIVKEGHRASEVIGSIRAMFKKDLSERKPLDVNALVREVLALAQDAVQAHRVTVRTHLTEDLPEVLADKVQLQQVLLNLINNGMEAMQQVTGRERQLTVTSDSDEADGILITVADAGTGIGADHMNHIFEPFFTTKASGMGMGLPICRSIVESHGGRLWAAPRYPNGTVFSLALPAMGKA